MHPKNNITSVRNQIIESGQRRKKSRALERGGSVDLAKSTFLIQNLEVDRGTAGWMLGSCCSCCCTHGLA